MKLGFKIYFENETLAFSLSSLTPKTSGNVTLYETSKNGINITYCLEKTSCGTIVDMTVESDSPLGITRIDSLTFSLPAPAKTDIIPFLGNDMLSSENRYYCELPDDRERYADCTGLLRDMTSSGMLLSVVSPLTNIAGAGVRKTKDGIDFFVKTEFTKAKRLEHRLSAERAFFSEKISVNEFFDAYRSFLPKSSFDMPKLMGWNTWDYYLDRVTPEDIYENIDALKGTPFADKLKYIVLDDGWQKDWGDWVENNKFACGLEAVAKRILSAGFLAGIWLAPLLMKPSCEGFEERMSWFCKDSDGNYICSEGGTYVIDPTIPEAKRFLTDTYAKLYSYGYRLFKVDYLSPLLEVKDLSDPSASAYSALSDLIRDIKAATGPDAVILGCSLPIQCGADIAPSMRIGVDIHNQFTHVKWIAEALAWSWQFNGSTTRIDPDFLVVRGKDTSVEELSWVGEPNYTAPKRRAEMTDREFFRSRWRQGDQFNEVEAETWAYLVAVSGGNIFLSDRMSVLNSKGISIIKNAIDAATDGVRPKYIKGDDRLPSLWLSDNKMLLINWSDSPAVISVETDAAEIESDKDFSFKDGTLAVSLLPHECFFAKTK